MRQECKVICKTLMKSVLHSEMCKIWENLKTEEIRSSIALSELTIYGKGYSMGFWHLKVRLYID